MALILGRLVGRSVIRPAATLVDLQTALATALHDSTGSGTGGIDWTFSIPDKDLDFLGAGETLDGDLRRDGHGRHRPVRPRP